MTVYTLFSQTGGGTGGDSSSFNFGNQFSVSQNAALTGIWWYSQPGVGGLPGACAIYATDTGTQVASTLKTSPTWSGAAGSGWVKCTYDGSVTLAAGTHYTVVVYRGSGLTWYSGTNGYWTSGAGASGITNGILSAPSSAGSVNGQSALLAGSGSIAFPTGTLTGFNWWVDVEVTLSGTSHTATVTSTATPSTVTHRGIGKALAVTVRPAAAITTAHQTGRTIAATVTPATVVQVSHRRAKSGGYYDYHHRAGSR